jgi:hypothetical protein
MTDLLQSGAWSDISELQLLPHLCLLFLFLCRFFGNKYRQQYLHCAAQEYIFQFGALSKAFVTVIICGLALYITSYTRSPPREVIKAITLGTLLIPVIAVIISINLLTARVYCTYEGSLPYEDSSSKTKIAVLAYSLTVIFPIYCCIVLDTIFSALLFLRVRELDVDNTGASAGEKAQLNAMVIRMQLYPIIAILAWLPNSFLYILANAYGIRPMFLRITAVLSLASSGVAISLNYFYHQRTYPQFIHQLLGTSIERQSMLHPVGEIESSFGSWSEVEGSYSSSATLPRQTTVSLPRGSGSSQPNSTPSTAERSYSLARKLLPRFDFRSHSSGGTPLNLGSPSGGATLTTENEPS